MTAPLSESSSEESVESVAGAGVGAGADGVGVGVGVGDAPGEPGAGVGAITTDTVFEVTVAASGTISFTTTVRPAAASFSTKAVEKAAEKLAALVGSASVSWTDVTSARAH